MKRSIAAALILIAGVGALIYYNSFSVPFIFDDIDSIVEDPSRRDLDLSWGNWFGTRAVINMTFDLNYHFNQLDIFGWHLVNLIIHIMSAAVVFWLVYLLAGQTVEKREWRFGEDEWVISNYFMAALVAGLLFISHPVQTQAVTYIVQRLASLTTLFYVLAMIGYVLFRKREGKQRYAWAAGSLIMTIIAMNSKETAFTLPIALLGMELVFFRKSWQVKYVAKRVLILLPWLLTMLIIPYYMLSFNTFVAQYFGWQETETGERPTIGRDVVGRLPDIAAEKSDLDRYSYFLTSTRVVVTYWRLLIMPYGQHLDYYYPMSETIKDWRVIAALVFHVFMIGVAVFMWCRKLNLGAFGIFIFYLTLMLESSVVPITDVIFEHRMYLPMVGAVLLAAQSVVSLIGFWEKRGGMSKAMAATSLIAIVVVTGIFGYLTWRRNEAWQSRISIWRDSVKNSPEKGRPHNNLGLHLLGEGEVDEAMKEFKKAVEVKPDYAEPRNNMCMILIQKGKPDEAEVELKEALRLKPDYSHALNNMGAIYMQRGDWAKAEEMFKQAVLLDKRYGGARDNLGMVLVNQGKLEEAREQLEINIEFNPDFVSSYNNLGVVYMRLGNASKARELLRKALEIEPGYQVARQNLNRLDGAAGVSGMQVFR